MNLTIEAEGLFEGSKPIWTVLRAPGVFVCYFDWSDPTQLVGILPTSREKDLDFKLTTSWNGWHISVPLWETTISVPITQVSSVAEVTQPIESLDLSSAIQDCLAISIATQRPELGAYLHWRNEGAIPNALSSLTLAIDIHVMRGDTIIATSKCRWDTGDITQWLTADKTVQLYGNLELLRSARSTRDDNRWHVVLRGDSELALGDFRSSKHWAGTVVVALDAIQSQP